MYRRRRPSRGQALVEFALILPVFIGLLFGLAEIAMIYGTAAMYNMAALQGARYEALSASRAGNVDQQTVSGILQLVQPYFVAHVVRVEVYRSDAQGNGPLLGADNSFDGSGTAQAPQTWPVASRTSTLSQPQFIGVRVTYAYTWLTSFVGATGSTLTLQATAVAPVQPMGG